MSFFITLPSNTLLEKNSPGDFRVELPHSIILEGEWEVALASISYTNAISYVRYGKYELILHNGIAINVRIRSAQYENIQQLVETLNYEYAREITPYLGTLAVDLLENKSRKKPPDRLELPETFEKALEFQIHNPYNHVNIKIDTTCFTAIQLSNELLYMLGFKERVLKKTNNLAEHPPDITGGISSLFVYTDIIAPQIVGDVKTNLLRIIPIEGEKPFGQVIVKEYKSLHYADLLKNNFNSVHVSIRSDDGERIKFIFGKTYLKLHFRRKLYLQ
jgi:hypothetical protein